MTHKTYVRFSNVYDDTTLSLEVASIYGIQVIYISNESVIQVIELLTILFFILIIVYAN